MTEQQACEMQRQKTILKDYVILDTYDHKSKTLAINVKNFVIKDTYYVDP